MVWWAVSSSASKSRRNSLTVNAIRPVGMGWGVAFDRGGHRQEGMGEHGQGRRSAMPGSPAPDLMLIDSCQAFGGLEGFLDAPTLAGDRDQRAQRHRARAVAAQVGVLAGGIVAADQQMMIRRCRCRLRPAAETRPRSTAAGRAHRHQQSASATRVGVSVRAARRRGSGRRGWAPAGWPRSPSHSPGRDREPPP